MRQLILIISGLLIVVLIFFSSSQENPEATELSSNRDTKNEKKEQKLNSVPSVNSSKNSNSIFLSENHDQSIDPDRDYLLWSKKSSDIEDAWNKEIYSHIQYIDREHAEELHRSYLQERKNYLAPHEKHLSDTLDELSRLNGESITDSRDYLDPEQHQDEFITKLRIIFRQDYEYIETQRKIFLDAQAGIK